MPKELDTVAFCLFLISYQCRQILIINYWCCLLLSWFYLIINRVMRLLTTFLTEKSPITAYNIGIKMIAALKSVGDAFVVARNSSNN